ncbi:hypothetical protein DDJ72_04055 [Mycobacteroides abscessus]|uniref:hypothetical protein n=1 Tax=Mycobacteroides abscessus TaxID=36809 RepID=UPI000D3E146C|nr:hypothetical protein [Mycobacteroides abscessus]PVA58074.1 hypothetical protein DDJ72_04055 [Mycobacteroides abscessus]
MKVLAELYHRVVLILVALGALAIAASFVTFVALTSLGSESDVPTTAPGPGMLNHLPGLGGILDREPVGFLSGIPGLGGVLSDPGESSG